MPTKTLQDICSETLIDNKADDVLTLDIDGISSFADAIIIATANSNRHAKSLSERLVESVKANGKTILPGLIDSHCHLIFENLEEDLEAVVSRWRSIGVKKLLHACCELSEIPKLKNWELNIAEGFAFACLQPLWFLLKSFDLKCVSRIK